MFRQITDYQFQILFQNILVTKNSNPPATKPGNLSTLITKHLIFNHFYLPHKITFCFHMKNLKVSFRASGAVTGTDIFFRMSVASHQPTLHNITEQRRPPES